MKITGGLKKSSEYQRAYKKGTRYVTRHFVFYLYDRGSDGLGVRLGITVTKKVGKAVRRNRIKRLIREVVRHRWKELNKGDMDIVILPKRGISIEKLTSLSVEEELFFPLLKALTAKASKPHNKEY